MDQVVDTPAASVERKPRRASVALWVVQIVLCGLYLYTGVTKLAMLPATLRGGLGNPPLFFPILGACEVLGALGLILPGALRLWPGLTAVAAGGLAVVMIGAVHALAGAGQTGLLWLPIAALVGDLFVLIGRSWWAPIRSRRRLAG